MWAIAAFRKLVTVADVRLVRLQASLDRPTLRHFNPRAVRVIHSRMLEDGKSANRS